MTTILSQVLGNNAFYTDSYIEDGLTFTKSILIKNHQEAKLYNDYLKITHPYHQLDVDVRTWRYYHHLQGLYHPLDKPISVISVDNGTTVALTRANLQVHKKTRKEILKFGLYYEDIIKLFPQQQLFVKAVALDPIYTGLEALIAAEDFTIVSCDRSFIEENEHDLIPQLQTRIQNYKSVWLIPYYQNLDNLFLASQYHIFYQFLFTSLLAIRLANAKTMQAHSFHIRLYLASHYKLDQQMLFLSRRQQLYLYRNLLYLSNHAGKNHVFRSLIDELFNEHNVSVVNYTYTQQNQTTPDHYTDYVYNQRLLNSKSLVHTSVDYPLDYIQTKEQPLAPSNRQEYLFNKEAIDRKNKHSLFSTLLTKDLETILVDETDSVKYKLLDTVTDYWAFMVKHEMVNFLTDVTDPQTNITVKLGTRDLFKFYVICLYAAHGISIDTFPVYRIKRVFNPTQPTTKELLGLFFEERSEYKGYLDTARQAVPMYRPLMTSYEFGEFVSGVYKLNIGLWHLLANYSDSATEGQMAMALDALAIEEDFYYDDESVETFLGRVGVKDPREYDKNVLDNYVFSLVDELFDKKLSYLKRLKKLQQALAEVFFNFNSYTVQLINNYYNDSPILAGVKDRRFTHSQSVKYNIGNGGGGEDLNTGEGLLLGGNGTMLPCGFLNMDPTSKHGSSNFFPAVVTNTEHYALRTQININALVELDVSPCVVNNVSLYFSHSTVIDTQHSQSAVSDTDLSFTTEIEHTGNKLSSYADIGLSVGYHSKTRYRSYMHRMAPINVDIKDDPSQEPLAKSSDPTLFFLALNP